MDNVPTPDEEFWGLHIWKRNGYEIVAPPEHELFTVMNGTTVEVMVSTFTEAELYTQGYVA